MAVPLHQREPACLDGQRLSLIELRALFSFAKKNTFDLIMLSGFLPLQVCELMERLGIELERSILPSLNVQYETAFRQCEACTRKDRCRDWLDRTSDEVIVAPEFCPNADILSELQFGQLK